MIGQMFSVCTHHVVGFVFESDMHLTSHRRCGQRANPIGLIKALRHTTHAAAATM